MAAGIQVFNDGGVLQIDQDYRNYHYMEYYDVYCGSQAAGGGSNFYGAVTIPGDAANIIAVVDSAYTFAIPVGFAGGQVNYNVNRYGGAGTVRLMLFRPTTPAASAFGRQVFDASGQLVFDSNWPAMRVLEFFVNPADGGAGSGGGSGGLTKSYGVGKVALAQLAPSFAFQTDPLPPLNSGRYLYTETATYLRAAGAAITFQEQLVRLEELALGAFDPSPYPNLAYGPGVFFALDVTGII